MMAVKVDSFPFNARQLLDLLNTCAIVNDDKSISWHETEYDKYL